MFVLVLNTFVEPTPTGMIVGNHGDEIDIADALAIRLKDEGKVELIDDSMAVPAGDGAPVVDPVKPVKPEKTGRAAATATPEAKAAEIPEAPAA